MAPRPVVVGSGCAGCCTVLSLFGVLILTVFGYGFSNHAPPATSPHSSTPPLQSAAAANLASVEDTAG
ncbi:hypothetical protein OC845_001794 [Tilletia horrida]|nr:hypothetical protein OC845_001794 [Tilletia horrida]